MSGRSRRGCNCDDVFCGVLHAAGACMNCIKERSRRCAACIQNEKDRKVAAKAARKAGIQNAKDRKVAAKAAREAAAAKKKAEAMCDCDGKCGRDGCDGGDTVMCGDKVTQSRASKCTKCSDAVKRQRETCATCEDKFRDGVCKCVTEYMRLVAPESTPTSDLYEGLRIPGGVLWEYSEGLKLVNTVGGKKLMYDFILKFLLPHALRYLSRGGQEPGYGVVCWLRGSCIEVELVNRCHTLPYSVSAWLQVGDGNMLEASQLCIYALEISSGADVQVTHLMLLCIDGLFPEGEEGAPHTIIFDAASGSMNPRLPGGLTRIQHVFPTPAVPVRAARGAVGAAGTAATVHNREHITMPGILHVPSFLCLIFQFYLTSDFGKNRRPPKTSSFRVLRVL